MLGKNNIKFKIGEIALEIADCEKKLVKATRELSDILKNLEYHGSLRERNSQQLDIHFDESILNKLKMQKWAYFPTPDVNISALGENWGNPKADLIILPASMNKYRIIVEIEKANKKTIWFDFIKFWMFIEAKQADAGILLCPINYSHTHGIWNLFDESCRYKRYLGRFAGVAKDKLNLISIIGYQQMIQREASYKIWNEKEFNILKKTV